MQERHIDYFSIQEPYSINGLVKGFSLTTTNQILGNQDPETRPMAAIICKPHSEPLHLLQHCTEYFTVCKLRLPTCRLNLISGYFQYAHYIDPYLDHLQSVIDKVKGEEIIICIDSKAHSPEWFANKEDDKGRIMLDFIMRNSLEILNTRFQPPTHKLGTNIDLTLSTVSIAKNLTSWKVLPEDTISDHNLILFDITVDQELQQREINKYSLKSANFETMNNTLSDEVLGIQIMPTDTANDLEDLVEAYQAALTKTCDEHLSKFKIRD